MLLNVWGVIWRIQKRLIQWTKRMPPTALRCRKSKAMARQAFMPANAFLSVVMLFFMGAASHYPMFGSKETKKKKGSRMSGSLCCG